MNYTEQERSIFGFNLPSGERRYADPLRVRRELLIHSSSQIDDWWDKYCLPNRIKQVEPNRELTPQETLLSLSVEDQLVGLSRRVFKLTSLEDDANGVEDEYCLHLLDAFFEWQETKKKTPGTTLASSAITASHQGADGSPTNSGSASSSVDSDCGCVKATI